MPSFIRGSGAILRQDSSLSEVVEIFDRHRSLRLKHFMRSGEAGHYGRRGIGLSTNRISMGRTTGRLPANRAGQTITSTAWRMRTSPSAAWVIRGGIDEGLPLSRKAGVLRVTHQGSVTQIRNPEFT